MTATVPPSPLPGPALRDELEAIVAGRPTRDAFAAQAAELIARATGAPAAALYGFDARADRLRVLATVNLDDEAVHALVGDGTHPGWDIPLRSLRNRRINVMESAQDNPFVPRPLLALNPQQMTIAVLPFYHAGAPAGAVVLFSPTPKAFPDTVLQTLSQPLRVCAAAVTELPSPAGAPDAPAPQAAREQPTLLRGVATLKAELARLTQALEESQSERAAEAAERVTAETFLVAAGDRIAELEKELADLRAGGQPTPQLTGQVDQLTRQLREAQTATETVRARATDAERQIAELERRAAAAEQRADAEAAGIEALTSMRDELQRRLQAARAQADERGKTLAQLEGRLRELTTHAEHVEQLRHTAEAELGRIRDEVGRAREERDKQAAALRETGEHLAAARSEARTTAARLAEAEVRLEQVEVLQKSLAGVRQQLDALAAERRDLAERLQGAEAARTAAVHEHEAMQQEWTARLAALESDRERAQQEIRRLRAHAGETLSQLQARLESGESERSQLTERVEVLAQAEAERFRFEARVVELEGEVAAAQEQSQVLEGRIRELGELNARVIAERRELHARIDALTEGGQTREQEKQRAVNAAMQRVTELEAAVHQTTKLLDATRSAHAEELACLRAEAERETTALRTELTAAIRNQEAIERTLEERQQALEAAQRASSRTADDAEQVRTAVAELEREHSALAARWEASTTELAQLQQTRDENERRIASLEQALRAAEAARDALGAELRETREHLEAATARQQAAAEAARRELELALESERTRRSTDLEQLQAEGNRLRAELNEQLEEMARRHEAAVQESKRLTQTLAEKEQLLNMVEQRIAAPEPAVAGAGLDEPLAIDLGVPPADGPAAASPGEPATPPPAEPAVAATEPDTVVILDDGDAATAAAGRLAEFGLQVSAIAPPPDFTGRAGTRPFACAAINLIQPTIWSALRSLRGGANGVRMPMVGYALPAGAKAGFWFGTIDFAVLPLKEGALTAALQRMVPKLKRVIAMSSDMDVMGTVRTQLSAARISTAVVLDGRQALDLLPTIRPEAAVLHLSPTCTDVFRAITGLRSAEMGRDIPILFLLDPTPQPREEAFFTGGVRLAANRGTLKAEELVNSLATAFGPYRAE